MVRHRRAKTSCTSHQSVDFYRAVIINEAETCREHDNIHVESVLIHGDFNMAISLLGQW